MNRFCLEYIYLPVKLVKYFEILIAKAYANKKRTVFRLITTTVGLCCVILVTVC
jgi:hypothetical protein